MNISKYIKRTVATLLITSVAFSTMACNANKVEDLNPDTFLSAAQKDLGWEDNNYYIAIEDYVAYGYDIDNLDGYSIPYELDLQYFGTVIEPLNLMKALITFNDFKNDDDAEAYFYGEYLNYDVENSSDYSGYYTNGESGYIVSTKNSPEYLNCCYYYGDCVLSIYAAAPEEVAQISNMLDTLNLPH